MVTQAHNTRISTAGLLLSAAAGLWMLLAPILGHMGPPWPCFIAGSGVLASLAMLWRRPEQRRGWSVLVIVISTGILFVGSSGIVPALLGIVGATLIIQWSADSNPEDEVVGGAVK